MLGSGPPSAFDCEALGGEHRVPCLRFEVAADRRFRFADDNRLWFDDPSALGRGCLGRASNGFLSSKLADRCCRRSLGSRVGGCGDGLGDAGDARASGDSEGSPDPPFSGAGGRASLVGSMAPPCSGSASEPGNQTCVCLTWPVIPGRFRSGSTPAARSLGQRSRVTGSSTDRPGVGRRTGG